MVLKRRINYGSRGYYLPPIRDIPKPPKRRRTARKKIVQNPLAAFDMLATVAGSLLKSLDTDVVPVSLDGALNYNSTLKKEPLEERLDQLEFLDQNSTNESSGGAFDSNPKTLIEKRPHLGTNGYEVQFTTKQEETDIDLVRSISSESSSEFSLYSGGFGVASDPNPSMLKTKLAVNRDDDENSSWCTDLDAVANKSLKRMKKSYVDKLKKLISRNKKYDAKVKVINGSKRKCYAQQISQKNRFKRKLCHNSSISSSNSQVRLTIKSFKVPELSIEIAESASIGALKRTVMEALAAVFEGELTVGVMLEGKKVKENSSTLREAGIFSNSPLLDTVRFTLEPEAMHSPLMASHMNSDSVDNRDVMDPPVSALPACKQSEDNSATPGSSIDPVPVPVPTTPVKSHVTDPDPVLSPTEVSSAEQAVSPISQAIIPLPVSVVKIEPLAVLPAVRKPRQVEALGQRRMRRPFSVSEVEALVAAVETLGTGRWRDVKIRAFDNAMHRTYVDLKDKWKTLVHTASIAPQQRRGEPVPQELLDRVLAAQTYWFHQHSKLAKSSIGEPGLVDYDSSPSPVKITSL